MRDKFITMRLTGTAAGAVFFILAAGCSVEAGGDMAAHDIAEKFAREAAKSDAEARKRAADARRKAEEADMLARARAEAEQRRIDMERAREAAERADRERKDAELRKAEAARKAEEEARAAEALRQAEIARKAEEEARAAEALRQAEIARKAEEEARAAEALRQAEIARKAEEEARAAEARRIAEQQESERRRLQAEREAEARRLAERLRSAREAHEERLAGSSIPESDPFPTSTAEPGERMTLGAGAWHEPPQAARYVTVLLLMEPGNRGIRRNNRTADPVLCGYHACYVSNGPDRAAMLERNRRVLGFFNTWGRRAGACNNSLGCVFRGVDLETLDGLLMPVDMRVLRHDRREPQTIDAASDCQLDRDRLSCRDGVYSDDYAMWIVPERLADRAGPAALLQALEDGLPSADRTASMPDWKAR